MSNILNVVERDGKKIYFSNPNLNKEVLGFVVHSWFMGAAEALAKVKDIANIRLAAERGGKKVFDGLINENPKRWTTKKWVELTTKYVHNPCGAVIEFTKITDDEVVFRAHGCPVYDLANRYPNAACFFSKGMWSALWKGAFPRGMVIVKKSMGHGAPYCEFKFVVEATEKDRLDDIKSYGYLSKVESGKMPKEEGKKWLNLNKKP